LWEHSSFSLAPELVSGSARYHAKEETSLLVDSLGYIVTFLKEFFAMRACRGRPVVCRGPLSGKEHHGTRLPYELSFFGKALNRYCSSSAYVYGSRFDPGVFCFYFFAAKGVRACPSSRTRLFDLPRLSGGCFPACRCSFRFRCSPGGACRSTFARRD